ncbi:MAG TPA: hypothetical protein VK459_28620 [Polyangiaceae bacterium]|nr:hypothetical protein [Polyangiaceae bacterium]
MSNHGSRPVAAPPGGAVRRVLRELMEDQELPGPNDRHIELPYSVLGRLVPGTDLIVAYIPAHDEVYVIALLRI